MGYFFDRTLFDGYSKVTGTWSVIYIYLWITRCNTFPSTKPDIGHKKRLVYYSIGHHTSRETKYSNLITYNNDKSKS